MTADYTRDLVDIKGKKYQPVASRLRMALDGPPEVVERLRKSLLHSSVTEVLYNTEKHLGVKVSVRLKEEYGGGIFDGVAESDRSAKSIEGDSPLEVAETSALGRALAKAGILIDLAEFASANEIYKNQFTTAARRPEDHQQPTRQAAKSAVPTTPAAARPAPAPRQQATIDSGAAQGLGLLKTVEEMEQEEADPRHAPDGAQWGIDKRTGRIRSRADWEGWISKIFSSEQLEQMTDKRLKEIVKEELAKRKSA